MPYDQRRTNGPEETTPYCVYVDVNAKQTKSSVKSELQVRQDSRKHDEFRKMYVKLGVVSQAKGSAYVELGQTKVICSVFDPREIHNQTVYCSEGKVYCEFKFSNFSCPRRKGHQQDAEEKQYSLLMQRALEPAVCRDEFPNFQVDVYALVLDNGGSALSAAIMGASLALANANVPMFGIVSAATVAIYDNFMILDPTDEEESLCLTKMKKGESNNHGIITQAILPQHNQISELFLVGSMDLKCINSAIDKLNKAGTEIYPILQQTLTKSVMKMFKKRKEEEE